MSEASALRSSRIYEHCRIYADKRTAVFWRNPSGGLQLGAIGWQTALEEHEIDLAGMKILDIRHTYYIQFPYMRPVMGCGRVEYQWQPIPYTPLRWWYKTDLLE